MQRSRIQTDPKLPGLLRLLPVTVLFFCLIAAAHGQTITTISPLPFSFSGMIFDAKGNLYGTTLAGGNYACGNGFGCGTVFELSPSSGGTWTQKVLYSFNGGADGELAQGGLVRDRAGNLYGTTLGGGGSANCGGGCGTVFRLTPTSSGWVETVIHSFSGPDGSSPPSALTLDSAGNLYGYTSAGGLGYGTVFKINRTGGKYRLLHAFSGANGYAVMGGVGPLTLDSAGNLYGVTQFGGKTGGNCGPGGCGTIFKLTPASGLWPYTVLHAFNETDGIYPNGGLVFDKAHNLYGSTSAGGAHGYGEVFKLSVGTSELAAIYSFTGLSDGGDPSSGLTFDPSGNLFGNTNSGLANGCDGTETFCGQVFELSPSTSGWQLSAQYPVGAQEAAPGGVVLDHLGNIYGIDNEYLYWGDGGGAYQIIP